MRAPPFVLLSGAGSALTFLLGASKNMREFADYGERTLPHGDRPLDERPSPPVMLCRFGKEASGVVQGRHA